MDAYQTRALGNLSKRHENAIRENAERIQEHVGYVLQRIASGHADSTGLYAKDIAASAQEIASRVAALEAIGELAVAREHLARYEGWSCTAEGDFCPDHKPATEEAP